MAGWGSIGGMAVGGWRKKLADCISIHTQGVERQQTRREQSCYELSKPAPSPVCFYQQSSKSFTVFPKLHKCLNRRAYGGHLPFNPSQ